jgi:hypothetical protein
MARGRLREDSSDLWRCKIESAADRELAGLPDQDIVQDAVDTILTLRADPYLGAPMRRYKDRGVRRSRHSNSGLYRQQERL